MKLKLKIKPKNKKKKMVVWIQKNKDLDDNALQICRFFKDGIKFSKLSRILRYHIISSSNPGVILSLFSAIQELIPETFFFSQDANDLEELVNS
ncbi:MAG: hypothetical protein ACXAAI_11320 [Promethearchaeota archaeon]|jgi:hypothetical protein